MSVLHEAVVAVFKQMNWEFRPVPGMEVIESGFEAHHTKIFVVAQTHAEAGIVTVVSHASFNVPTTHLRAACELLMRTNKQLNLGNLELDWDSGQVMFRIASVFAEGAAIERKVIASLVHTAVAEMDRLTPYLSELARLGTGELLLLSVPELMQRGDLAGE
jgi:hypothetical protein